MDDKLDLDFGKLSIAEPKFETKHESKSSVSILQSSDASDDSHQPVSKEEKLSDTFEEFEDDDDFLPPNPFFSVAKSEPTKPATSSNGKSVLSGSLAKYIRSIDKKCGVTDVTRKKKENHKYHHHDSVEVIEEVKEKFEVITLSDESYSDNEEDLLSTPEKIKKLPITHPKLEELDPNPNIQKLFREFDNRFFDGYLTDMEVKLKWAGNLYSTAGKYFHRTKTIHLASRLFEQRPRADLVETMLHEMIHSYVHQKKLPSADGSHGKSFKSLMNRINKIAGTNITIRHGWNAEVRALKKYHWKCTGHLCQNSFPYRGHISLPIQRKPNRFDYTFRLHEKLLCTGEFVPISDNFTTIF